MKIYHRLFISSILCSLFYLGCSLGLAAKALASNNTDETLTAKHNLNVGKIVFTDSGVSQKGIGLENVTNKLDLNNDKNFYFTAFLSKPLTAYLQVLAPNLSAEEVNKTGNYQFTFYVNDTLVYTENLTLGAGLFSEKNTIKILSKPLFSERNEDSWGRFLWMRFMHFGGEEVLTDGKHDLRIQIRPYVKNPEIIVGEVIASGQVSIEVIKPKASEAQIAIQPIQAGSGWDISADSLDQDKIRAMNKKIAQNDFKHIRSVVIIKDGELLLEEYFNDADRSTLHDPRSVGKSFASTMLGIAINEGHIAQVEAKIGAFYELKDFDNYSQRKADVTLKQLLTMSSGFDGDDTKQESLGNEENMYPTDDWVKFTLDLPMRAKSTKVEPWAYFTAGATLLGDILHQTVPGGLEAYAHQKLFEPLNIESYEWQYTPQKVANTAGGLRLRALDFAKYGQLYKNDGVWNGEQIIPVKWARDSLSKQVSRGEQDDGHYGYLFWHDVIPLGDQLYEVAYAIGNGGNKIYIFKDIPFVIVITATAYNKPFAHSQVNQMMGRYILPAVLPDI